MAKVTENQEDINGGQTVEIPEKVESEKVETESKTAETVIGDFMAMPEITETDQNPEPVKDAPSLFVSPSGETFDPEKHIANKDGHPVVVKKGPRKGMFRLIPGRKKDGPTTTKVEPESQEGNVGANQSIKPDSTESIKPAMTDAEIEAAAKGTAAMIFQLGMLAGGEEWAPIVDRKTGTDEPAMMTGAWASYYRQKGVVDLPPGLVVVGTMIAYAGPRFTMPKTQTRWEKAKAFFGRRDGAKNGQ